MGPAAHPIARLTGQRNLQVLSREGCLSLARSRHPALVVPQRLFAKHPFATVRVLASNAFVQHGLRLPIPIRSQFGCAGFVPELTIARVLLLQLPNDTHGIIEASLAIVEKQQRELGICLRKSWVGSRLFDHPQATLFVATKPHDVGHQTHRHRQRGHDVAIGADNETGVLPRGIHLQDLLVRVIRATGGTER